MATIDGTDDGMYQGLPIEVEGEGLYADLKAAGRTVSSKESLVTGSASAPTPSQPTSKASKIPTTGLNGDGMYKGLPIEVTVKALYTNPH